MSTQETAHTLFLDVDGTNFAYRIIGSASPATPPLLLLNHFRSNIDLVSISFQNWTLYLLYLSNG